jgi:hypothetical protein
MNKPERASSSPIIQMFVPDWPHDIQPGVGETVEVD